MKRFITLLLTLCILLSSVVTINAMEIPYTEMETVNNEDKANELQPLAADDGCDEDEDGDGIPDDEEDDGTMGGLPTIPSGGNGGGSLEIYGSIRSCIDENFYSNQQIRYANVNNPVKLAQLQAQCPGEWKKAYWNGYLDGEPMSYHFFKNMTTNQVHDVKIVYEWWNQ